MLFVADSMIRSKQAISKTYRVSSPQNKQLVKLNLGGAFDALASPSALPCNTVIAPAGFLSRRREPSVFFSEPYQDAPQKKTGNLFLGTQIRKGVSYFWSSFFSFFCFWEKKTKKKSKTSFFFSFLPPFAGFLGREPSSSSHNYQQQDSRQPTHPLS